MVALLLLSYGCLVSVNVLWLALHHGVVGWSADCDCGIYFTYSLTCLLFPSLSSDFCYLLTTFAHSFGPISGTTECM